MNEDVPGLSILIGRSQHIYSVIDRKDCILCNLSTISSCVFLLDFIMVVVITLCFYVVLLILSHILRLTGRKKARTRHILTFKFISEL